MSEESKKKAVLEVETLFGRVSRLEDVKEALERSVGCDKHRINNLEANRIPKVERGAEENHERLDDLDAVTLPRIDNNMKDLDKRLSGVEKAVIDIMNDLEAKKDE